MKFTQSNQQSFSHVSEPENQLTNTAFDKSPDYIKNLNHAFRRMIINMMVLLTCMLCLVNANAQSIAPDGDFDADINGWHCGSVNPTWISDDGSQLSGNGSLQWSVEDFISAGGRLGGGHCDWITVSAENNYKYEGSFKLPTDSEFENIVIEFYWYTEAEEFISAESFMLPTNSITRDTWTRFERFSSSPVGATKLAAYLAFEFYLTGQNEVSAFMLWDDLKVIKLTDNIFTDGFE